ncbi:MAG TPA: polyphosphate kinase 2 family protein [Candidatus Methylacidiphilales bacterium]|nr:polyphosphate kinase 2 family protein [Candidatus Methylacidiphilales bacterium]
MKFNRKKIAGFAERYRVSEGSKFRFKDIDPGETPGLKSDEQAQELLNAGINVISHLQEKLYAQERWSLLLIFQAMDAAGKDGTIKHVMSGINPQGCQVTSFKSPSSLELRHDFLWRTAVALPERGKIGIFNRSYYEEVLVVRVHKEFLKAEKLPESLITRHIWKERFHDINAYERYLARNGVIIRKFFLHISKSEQKRRFLARLDEPAKNWKFSASDLKERAYWDDYMQAYEDMICHTSSPAAPWYVVPANDKRFARLVVGAAVIDALDSLKLEFPKVTTEQRQSLDEARRILKS